MNVREQIAAVEEALHTVEYSSSPTERDTARIEIADVAPVLIAAVKALEAALQECQEWFQDRADVSDGPGACDPPRPNAAMSMQILCDAALAQLDERIEK